TERFPRFRKNSTLTEIARVILVAFCDNRSFESFLFHRFDKFCNLEHALTCGKMAMFSRDAINDLDASHDVFLDHFLNLVRHPSIESLEVRFICGPGLTRKMFV